ncbi:MAG: hypothetical protein MK106_15095 [Mariniblastus sp.]|nr:hypothetical protein [Mariniblastus sp.]
MSGSNFFVKPCPACGRSARISLDYLGKMVCCKHCGREFLANDPENESAAELDPVNYWINFTETNHSFDQEAISGSQRYPR